MKLSDLKEGEVVTALDADLIITKLDSMFIMVSKNKHISAETEIMVDFETQQSTKDELFKSIENIDVTTFHGMHLKEMLNTRLVKEL